MWTMYTGPCSYNTINIACSYFKKNTQTKKQMKRKDHYELIILGGGPAGLSAGLYASRARIDHLMIEKAATGGQVLLTDWVDNYPGFPEGISGFDLVDKMTEHAKRFDLYMLTAEVI